MTTHEGAPKRGRIDRDAVIRLRNEGRNSETIAATLGHSKNAVRRVIKQAEADGLVEQIDLRSRTVPPAPKRGFIDRDAVIRLRNEGHSRNEIAATLGCSPTGVHNVIKQAEADGLVEEIDLRPTVVARALRADPNTPALTRYLLDHLQNGETLDDLTVLSSKRDPFRVASVADAGRWFARALAAIDAHRKSRGESPLRRIHNRGVRYGIMGIGEGKVPMVGSGLRERNGTVHTHFDSSNACWRYLNTTASQAARWMGLVPFSRIRDKRNGDDAFKQYTPEDEEPQPFSYNPGNALAEVDLTPTITLDMAAWQPYYIVLCSEKSGASDLLQPLAEEYEIDECAPDGEITTTLCWEMARRAVQLGKPLVVIEHVDGDPAGFQMPISLARKLQALKPLEFPTLEFVVVQALLTPSEARRLDLPSMPLKDEDSAKNQRWRKATGIDQVELDALSDADFERLSRTAIEQFYDTGLAEEVRRLREEWDAEVEPLVEEATSAEQIRLRDQVIAAIAAYQRQVQADLDSIELPPLPPMPVSDYDFADDSWPDLEVVADSRLGFRDLSAQLKSRKRYLDQFIDDDE